MMRGEPCWLFVVALLLGLLGDVSRARAQAAGGDYEIGPGDVLSVVVIGQAPMTGSFPVDTEGMVNFPILGKIKAAQHTTVELERKLTTLLADGILRRPQVTVSIAEYGSQRVFVTGEVQRPGRYALKADRSLLGLLGDIGALGSNAGHEVIVIRPPAAGGLATAAAGPLSVAEEGAAVDGAADDGGKAEDGKGRSKREREKGKNGKRSEKDAPEDDAGNDEASAPAAPTVPGLPFVAPGSEVFRVSLLELQSGNPERNLRLQAGDTVYFPRAAQVYVMGSVFRPGPYRFEEGMTVLQALTLAGGATERGSAGRTKVVRIVDGKKVEKKAKATDLVQPEDTLVVPERFF
jgi:polysaccharide export outer membrane protein